MAIAPETSENLQAFQRANENYAASFKEGQLPLPPIRKVMPTFSAMGRPTTDALHALAVSQRQLGTTEVHVIHHTNCDLSTFTNEEMREKIKTDLGVEIAPDTDFHPIKDREQSVRDDVHAIQSSPIIAPGTPVFGHVYDVATGKLTRIQ